MMCVCVCVCVFLRFSIISHVSTRRQAEFELRAGLGHRLTRSHNHACSLASSTVRSLNSGYRIGTGLLISSIEY
jgi:hypothetical protein